MPEVTGNPSDYFIGPVVLRAYNKIEHIADAEVVELSAIEKTLAKFFSKDEISFVLVRYVAYGCYSLRVERNS